MSNEIVRLSKQLVEAEAAYFDKGFVAVEDSSFGVGDGNQCGSGWKGIFLVRDGQVQSDVVPSMFFLRV